MSQPDPLSMFRRPNRISLPNMPHSSSEVMTGQGQLRPESVTSEESLPIFDEDDEETDLSHEIETDV